MSIRWPPHTGGGLVLVQIATQVFPFLEIPNWTIRLVILITTVGFPVALIIAWAFELTPEGIKRTEGADAAPTTFTRRVWIAVVVVAAALSLGLFFLGRSPPGRNDSTERGGYNFAGKSIAVLPLVNTSGDPANEYFSDGLSEELIAVLAKIPDLKVIGRSSSFLFKGKSDDTQDDRRKTRRGQSNRRQCSETGRSRRIVAELINSADGRSLWSETYDRDLQGCICGPG